MDLDQYIKFVMALLFVVLLIVAVAWVLRRLGLGGVAVTRAARQRRLGVVEVLALDAKRRLVLVRRDDREHLILLSATGDLVVESAKTGGGAGDFRSALSASAASESNRGTTP